MNQDTNIKVFLVHNGCLRRGLDTSRLAKYFAVNGCRIVKQAEEADYLIFVTCAFIKSKEKECFRLIDILKKYKRKLIIAGCLPAIAEARFREAFKGEFVVTKNLHEIDHIFKAFKVKFSHVPDAHFQNGKLYFYEYPFLHAHPFIAKCIKSYNAFRKKLFAVQFPRRGAISMNIPFMKSRKSISHIFWKKPRYSRSCHLRVSYGCTGKCSYCTIRKAIGNLKSKTLEVCKDEYKKLLHDGNRHFVMLADDLGSYGLDIGSSFAQLLQCFSFVDKNFNVTWAINHLHPRWMIDYKDELLKIIQQGKITLMLCAIQSGSSRILRLMNRYSNCKDIEDTLFKFKKANPGLLLYTNIIIGFPSETDEDFFSTIDLVRRVKFDRVWLFSYYDNGQTISSSLDSQLSTVTIRKRVKIAKKVLSKERIPLVCDNNVRY